MSVFCRPGNRFLEGIEASSSPGNRKITHLVGTTMMIDDQL